MSDAPETVHLVPNSGFVNGWARPELTDEFDDDGTEYRRADLPPTLAAALALPEIAALVEAAERMRDYIKGPMIDRVGPILRQADAALRAAREKE